MPQRRNILILGAALAGVTGAPIAAAPGDVTEYVAEYDVRYNGRRVARAEFSVTATTGDRYEFRSTTRARGIWRLASPNPAIDHSEFEARADGIEPLRFEYQDGSRKGEDNFTIEFDRQAGEARIRGEGGEQAVSLEPGLLDRGSLQVALMRDLGACRLPGPYRYLEDDGQRVYSYERVDDRATDTGIGELDTVRFVQQREGSSRRTVLWLAKELAYLPVRIEQIRDDEVETVFALDSVTGIERRPGCLSFR